MNICAITCAVTIAAIPALAQEPARGIDLIPGHPIYHDEEREAGVAMALALTPAGDEASDLIELCEELRVAAGLGHKSGDELRLETVFVVPYKDLAVEGLYLPMDERLGSNALIQGKSVARATLDGILARAGIPPRILDEEQVEQEVSCARGEPLWFIAWHDVRPIGEEEPEAVIERARQRFLAVHQSVVEHNAAAWHLQKAARRG
jgi:hypothetical protein